MSGALQGSTWSSQDVLTDGPAWFVKASSRLVLSFRCEYTGARACTYVHRCVSQRWASVPWKWTVWSLVEIYGSGQLEMKSRYGGA